MIELELTTDREYLLWLMDKWTPDELQRAISRHRERRGFVPTKIIYNPADQERINQLNTTLKTTGAKHVPTGYINLN